MKKYTKEEILNFNPDNWIFRRSSGYAGYDPISPSEYSTYRDEQKWIYEQDFFDRKRLKEQYEKDYNLIAQFRNEHLPFGLYSECVIQEFLDKKYFSKVV